VSRNVQEGLPDAEWARKVGLLRVEAV
jgi:hypothetical protein